MRFSPRARSGNEAANSSWVRSGPLARFEKSCTGGHSKADVVPMSEGNGEQRKEHRGIDLIAHAVRRCRTGALIERAGCSHLDLRNATRHTGKRRLLGYQSEPGFPATRQQAGHADKDAGDEMSLS